MATLYFNALGWPLRSMHIPRSVLDAGSYLLQPFHPGMARIIKVSLAGNIDAAAMDVSQSAEHFGIIPVQSENFVKEKVRRSKKKAIVATTCCTIIFAAMQKPTIYTSLSPALLPLYELKNSIVVVIDILRATSTIATALYNGAREIIPVDSVEKCIRLGKELECITAGERDGKVAEGLQYGNSSFEYPRTFVEGKILVLTTTNGTRLLHMALAKGATEIITGSFLNLSAVCTHLAKSNKNVVLACAGWKDKVNLEDTLFAGAVVDKIKDQFSINCDATHIALNLYKDGQEDMYEFMKRNDASHYHRLTNFGLEKDIRHCLTPDVANVLPEYIQGKLVVQK